MKENKTWKIWSHFLGYFMCFVIGGIIASVPRFIVGFDDESEKIVLLSELLRIPITLALLFLYTKYISKLNINKKILNFTNFKPIKWGLVGVSLPLIVLLIFYLSGNLSIHNFHPNLDASIITNGLLKVFGMSLAAGIIEEVLFRGYLVHLLNKKYSFWLAVIIPSILFPLIHLGGADSFMNGIQIFISGFLVSIMFLLIYLRTGSIWNASIVHFLWNLIFINKLISFGNIEDDSNKLLELNLGSNEFFNGGGFGIETSIPAIIVYSITIIAIWKLTDKKAYNTMYKSLGNK